jgi:hypothetical protein
MSNRATTLTALRTCLTSYVPNNVGTPNVSLNHGNIDQMVRSPRFETDPRSVAQSIYNMIRGSPNRVSIKQMIDNHLVNLQELPLDD